MRSTICAVLLASCAAVMCQSASAADLPVKAPVLKAPVSAWDWTGFYVGGYVGAGVNKSRSRDPNSPTNGNSIPGDLEHTGAGFTGGATAGPPIGTTL